MISTGVHKMARDIFTIAVVKYLQENPACGRMVLARECFCAAYDFEQVRIEEGVSAQEMEATHADNN